MEQQLTKIHPYLWAGIDNSLQTSYINQKNKHQYDLNYWIDYACYYHNITITEFHSKKRFRKLVGARQMAVYLYVTHRDKLNMQRLNLTQIGNMLDKNHATIIHSIRAFENLMFGNKQLKKDVTAILKNAIYDNRTEQQH